MDQVKTAKREIGAITQLRGIASLMVVFFHLFSVTSLYFGQTLNDIFQYGKYGVQFFFVISGFVVSYSMMVGGYTLSNFGQFLKKRLIRIEPPYLLVLLLTVGFLFIRHRLQGNDGDTALPDARQILFHIGYLIPFSPYSWLSIVFWTLAIEFQFYLLISLTIGWLSAAVWSRALVSAVFLVIGSWFTDASLVMHWLPIFLVGIYLALHKRRIVNDTELLIAMAVFGIVIFSRLGWVIGLFTVIPSVVVYYEPVVKSATLKFFGDISYSLYLVHTLVMFPIVNIGIRKFSGWGTKTGIGILAFGAAVLISYLIYRFVELPCKKWAAGIGYK